VWRWTGARHRITVATASNTTNDSTTTTEGCRTVDGPLAGHDWARTSVVEQFPLPSEPPLAFGSDGRVDGFDGYHELSDEVDVDDVRIRYTSGTAPASPCGSEQQLQLDDVPFSIDDGGEAFRLTLLSRSLDRIGR
jgi:hypothetical protein